MSIISRLVKIERQDLVAKPILGNLEIIEYAISPSRMNQIEKTLMTAFKTEKRLDLKIDNYVYEDVLVEMHTSFPRRAFGLSNKQLERVILCSKAIEKVKK